MAADAHGLIEVRERNGSSWSSAAMNVRIDRDYLLFACLAHVRLHQMPHQIVEGIRKFCQPAKGLPEDWVRTLADPPDGDDRVIAWVRHWQTDGHSWTWLTYDELIRVAMAYMVGSSDMDATNETILDAHRRGLSNPDLEAIMRYMSAYHARGYGTRLLVWFDN